MDGIFISDPHRVSAMIERVAEHLTNKRILSAKQWSTITVVLSDDIDMVEQAASRYLRSQKQASTALASPFPKDLARMCQGARNSLLAGLKRVEILYRLPRKETEARVLTKALLRHTGEIARGICGLARSSGILAGAAVLALGTYAIWHSTQSESSRKYITV